ncbi:MAG TPA: 50S ribosomal protein L4 [Caldithrix abyssi]|uniref:Large ribosomal subunit protein uL4 n=1 Tax=Caldithrix abyssi TaxID=187145 RepID=A0A7V4U4S1_CALAY|nr:50S ribosomal protein L4 [Caldithrix abyssi]
MNVAVFDINGKKTGKEAELNDTIFAGEINEHVVWLDIKALMANKRQGTHATKGRSYVSGGGRKPFRQKGTGRARQGSTRAPHHVGGGRVFGPSPHGYYQKVNKKVKKIARRSALTDKAQNQNIVVIEDFQMDAPKTKTIISMLEGFKLSGKRVLILTNGNAPNIYKSAENVYKVEVREDVTFSSYDVVKAHTILIQEGALNKINEVLG